MTEFIKRLTSRKFLLAVAAFLTAIANGEILAACAVAIGYIGVEGAKDYADAGK
jgi:hypothetical protein